MPVSFWIFLIVCFVSFIVAIDDHSAEWTEFREKKGCSKFWKGLKIFSLWFVCAGSFVGTLVLGWESTQDNKENKNRDLRIVGLSNQVVQVSSKYDEATNDLALAQNDAIMASNSATSANNAAQNLKRHLTDDQKMQMYKAISQYPPGDVVFSYGINIPDAVGIGNDIADVLNGAKWHLILPSRISAGNFGFGMGIVIEGAPNNSQVVNAIVSELNLFNLYATADTNGFTGSTLGGVKTLDSTNEILVLILDKPPE